MLAFVMLWAYFSFSQYLIIYSGNLPEEITWYTRRLQHRLAVDRHGARAVAFRGAVPHPAVAAVKRNPQLLVKVAIGIIVVRLIDLFWLIAPEFHRDGFVAQLARRRCCRCRSAASGSAASSGSSAAGRCCRSTIRSSTRRSARSSRRRRSVRYERRMRTHLESIDQPTVHHEETDVNIRAIFGFAGALAVAGDRHSPRGLGPLRVLRLTARQRDVRTGLAARDRRSAPAARAAAAGRPAPGRRGIPGARRTPS